MRYTVSGADTLQKRVTEASGRTIPQSTIDDVVRALGLTAKVAERVHPGRDPIASDSDVENGVSVRGWVDDAPIRQHEVPALLPGPASLTRPRC